MRIHPGKIIILVLILLFCSTSKAQDTSITIKVDTVKIQKTKLITIVKVKTVAKFILHVKGG